MSLNSQTANSFALRGSFRAGQKANTELWPERYPLFRKGRISKFHAPLPAAMRIDPYQASHRSFSVE
jgi:hypothetical protein